MLVFALAFGTAALALVVYDLAQREHAILRNYPLIGHLRFWLEAVGPELRQYIVTSNDEERPFSRDERRWVYTSSKRRNNYFGYGTDNDLERSANYLIIKHQTLPLAALPPGDANDVLPCAKILGAHRGRARAFRPGSVVNVSGMSFGSLSGAAVEALNRGARLAGCLHNTGEGGTGAGPLAFSDHVALPFKIGFTRVYRTLAEQGMHEKIVFIGSGRLGLPATALYAFALGCDMVNVAREAMMAIGCIQAQRCHTGACPAGVATQNPWLTRGLDPGLKSARVAHYLQALRHELLQLSRACGVVHPALVDPDRIEILDDRFGSKTARELFGYADGWGVPSATDREEIAGLVAD